MVESQVINFRLPKQNIIKNVFWVDVLKVMELLMFICKGVGLICVEID